MLAVFNASGELTKQLKFETSKNYKDFLHVFHDKFEELGDIDFKAGAVAIPGVVDRKEGIGIAFGNLEWKRVHIKADVEKIIKAPVAVENDAKTGGLYEAIYIKNDFRKVLYITIGTGIGIALTTDGIINTDISDWGGKVIMLDYSGRRVSWEQIASGKAIFKKFGKKASDITDAESWKQIARNIAKGLINVLAITEPDVVVIAGGVGTHYEKFDNYLKSALKKYETPMMKIPPIRPANKPEEAVVYGCFELIKQTYGHHFK